MFGFWTSQVSKRDVREIFPKQNDCIVRKHRGEIKSPTQNDDVGGSLLQKRCSHPLLASGNENFLIYKDFFFVKKKVFLRVNVLQSSSQLANS
jgi:hypothetical protein